MHPDKKSIHQVPGSVHRKGVFNPPDPNGKMAMSKMAINSQNVKY